MESHLPPELSGSGAGPTSPAQPDSPFVDIHGRTLHLAGLYRNASCFIILPGPSIRSLDLSLLNRRGIVTFGVNNSPAIFRPNIWTHVDAVDKFHESIWLDPAILKIVNCLRFDFGLRRKLANGRFVPMILNARPTLVRDMPGVIGDRRNGSFEAARYLTEPSTCWGISAAHAARLRRQGKWGGGKCLNVMLAVLKQAYSLGFHTVYLLGCDFRMEASGGPGGSGSISPYAFEQSKDDRCIAANNKMFGQLNAIFAELRTHFDAAGYRVFNCNSASGLTAFEYRDYRQAIESATAGVPQDPLDTADWYTGR